jgi:DNA-binding NarL/FixJ family response regulator
MDENKIIKYEFGLIKRVEKALRLTNKLLLETKREIHVVHFDDHKLFLDGVKNAVSKYFSDFNPVQFTDGLSALAYIEKCAKEHKRIDLIITGFIQPSMNGNQFASEVRKIEVTYSTFFRILLLTMVSKADIEDLFLKGYFDKYLSKNTNGEQIADYILWAAVNYNH